MRNFKNSKYKVICPYCNKKTLLLDSKLVYGKSYGLIYYCGCGAFVGVHKGTHKPLGTPARAELRQQRSKCHAMFDPVWKDGEMTRNAAYKWLASKMGISVRQCHIGMFNEMQCDQVIEIMRARWDEDE